MVRRWVVKADPATGLVDRQAVVEALMDGEAMVHRAGGSLTMVVDRVPLVHDGRVIPGAMGTSGAIFEWKDRTGDAKPQPEVAVAPVAVAEEPVLAAEPEPEPPLADEVHAEVDEPTEPDTPYDDAVRDDDGELEDVSSIPLALR